MVRAVQISRCLELPEISTQNTEILFYQFFIKNKIGDNGAKYLGEIL